MDAQIPIAVNTDPGSMVDATRPFRSVKEAVAIFGERLFLRETKLSPKAPDFIIEKDVSSTTQVQQNSSRPSSASSKHSGMEDEEVVDSSVEDSSGSVELSPEVFPSNSSVNAVDLSLNKPSQNPYKLSHFAGEQDECSSLDRRPRPYPLEITESASKPPVIAYDQIGNSPMYELKLPSPQIPRESHGNIVHGNDLVMMLMVLKKLEADLQETKMELKLLKERESETEVGLASLNAELHKNMSKIAKAEAAEAGKAASRSSTSNEGINREMEQKTEDRARSDMMIKTIDSPTLAQILSISDYEGYVPQSKTRTKKLMKKKPIIPLVTDIFQWKKKPSPNHDISRPIFSSQMYFA